MIKEIDKACSDIVDANINMSVPWYLMASHAYYVSDNPILSDRMFDRLVKIMINEWDNIEHMHKDCITLDMLSAGTFLGSYPSRVQYAVEEIRETYDKRKRRKR